MSPITCACEPLRGPCDLHRMGMNNRNPYAGRLQGEVVFCAHGMLIEGPTCPRCQSDFAALTPQQASCLRDGQRAATQRGFPPELMSNSDCPQCGSDDRHLYAKPCGTKYYGISPWHASGATLCPNACPVCKASNRLQRRLIYKEFEQLIPGFFIKPDYMEAVKRDDAWHLANLIAQIPVSFKDLAGEWMK